MPKEQRERLEELAQVVNDMELGRTEDELERRRDGAERKREVAVTRRRLQREIRKSSREVRTHETETKELRREVNALERDEEALIGRKLKRDEKFEDSFAKVKSKENEKNLQRLSKRTETGAAHEKLSHLKVALQDLEENHVKCINDDPRGAQMRSPPQSMTSAVLEVEVEKLFKESHRLDKENAKLRQELEKVKANLLPRDRKKVDAALATREAFRRPSSQERRPLAEATLEASQRAMTASPGRMPWRIKEDAAPAVSFRSGSVERVDTRTVSAAAFSSPASSYSLPNTMVGPSQQLSYAVSMGPVVAAVPGSLTIAPDAKGPIVPAFAWGTQRVADITPLRVPPVSAASLSEAPLTGTTAATLNTPTPNRQQRPVGPWAWAGATVEVSPAVQAPPSLAVGSRVEALYSNGRWYPAVVDSAERPDGSVALVWDDGAQCERSKKKYELRTPSLQSLSTALATSLGSSLATPLQSLSTVVAQPLSSGRPATPSPALRSVTPSAALRSPTGSPIAARVISSNMERMDRCMDRYQPLSSPIAASRMASISSPPAAVVAVPSDVTGFSGTPSLQASLALWDSKVGPRASPVRMASQRVLPSQPEAALGARQASPYASARAPSSPAAAPEMPRSSSTQRFAAAFATAEEVLATRERALAAREKALHEYRGGIMAAYAGKEVGGSMISMRG